MQQPSTAELPMSHELTQEHLAKAEKMQHIVLIIEDMPQQMKDIFILAYCGEKLGDGEIAAYLGIKPAVVRKEIRKAIQLVKEALTKRY